MKNGFTRHARIWKKNCHDYKQSWNKLVTNFLKDFETKEIGNEYKIKHIFDCINNDSIWYNDDSRRYFC